MRYAIRYSPDIHADLARGWSAWMEARFSSLLDLVETYCGDYDVADYLESCDSDIDNALLDLADARNLDVRRDPATGQWCLVHHDGLSCYALNAASMDAALDEGAVLAAAIGEPVGNGDRTYGDVSLVADLGAGWYLLQCDDTIPEL